MLTLKQLNEEFERFLEMYGDYGNTYNRDINKLLKRDVPLIEIYNIIQDKYPKLSKRNILDELRLSALDYENKKYFAENGGNEIPDDTYKAILDKVDSQIRVIDKEK